MYCLLFLSFYSSLFKSLSLSICSFSFAFCVVSLEIYTVYLLVYTTSTPSPIAKPNRVVQSYLINKNY